MAWTDEQKDAFLRQQFHAQHAFYHEQWPNASYEILLLGGEPIGRLYVDRREQEISVMDIALLPGYQGRGIGAALLHEIIAESVQILKSQPEVAEVLVDPPQNDVDPLQPMQRTLPDPTVTDRQVSRHGERVTRCGPTAGCSRPVGAYHTAANSGKL